MIVEREANPFSVAEHLWLLLHCPAWRNESLLKVMTGNRRRSCASRPTSCACSTSSRRRPARTSRRSSLHCCAMPWRRSTRRWSRGWARSCLAKKAVESQDAFQEGRTLRPFFWPYDVYACIVISTQQEETGGPRGAAPCNARERNQSARERTNV